MVKNSINQKGSTLVVIVIILIFALLGALGFIFWQNFINKASSTTSEDGTSKVTSQIKDADKQKETDSTKYLIVKEWGVKIPLTDGVTGLSYSLDQDNVAHFRSFNLDSISGDCTSNSVNVARGKANEIVVSEVSSTEGSSFKEAYEATVVDENALSGRSIKNKVGDYYYVVPGYSGASCLSSLDKMSEENTAVIAIVKAIRSLRSE